MHLNPVLDAVAGTDADRDERARIAVQVFRTMLPGLSAYARAVTHNSKVRVELSAGPPETNGTIIKYRPPIELGDKTPHNRSKCDKRDGKTGLLVCPACAIREQVLVNIYHEIAHICFGTFAEVTPADRIMAINAALRSLGDVHRETFEKRVSAAPEYMKRDYLNLSGLINPFLPDLFNMLEDARVDSNMFLARKGTRKMMEADLYRILREGITTWGPTPVRWMDQPLNAQAVLATYLIGAGYESWESFLHPKIVEDFEDEKLRELLANVKNTRTAADTYTVSLPILARLRELGYMLTPEEQEEQAGESDDEPDTNEENKDDDGAGAGGPADDRGSGDEPDPEGEGLGDDSDDGDADTEAPAGDFDGEADPDGDEAGQGGEPEAGGEEAGEGSDSSGEEGTDPGSGAGGEPADESDDTEPGVDGHGDQDERDASDSQDGAGPKEEGEVDDVQPDTGAAPDRDAVSDEPTGEGQDSPDHSDAEGEGEAEASSDTAPPLGEAGGDSDADDRSDQTDGDAGEGDGQDLGPDHTSSGEAGGQDDAAGTGAPELDDGVGAEGEPDEDPQADQVPDAPGGAADDGAAAEDGSDGDVGEPAGDLDRPDGAAGDEAGAGDRHDLAAAAGDAATPDGSTDPDTPSDRDNPQPDPDTTAPEPGDRPEREGVMESGADEGLGGIKVEEAEEQPLPEYGNADDLAPVTGLHGEHDPTDPSHPDHKVKDADDKAIAVAVVQGQYFETPSTNIVQVNEYDEANPGFGFSFPDDKGHYHELDDDEREYLGIDCDMDVPESAMGPALMQLRRLFTDNKIAAYEPNRRSGRINKRVLGRRAWGDDDRLFGKKRLPNKKSYAVLIGIDISGSTLGDNLVLAKRAAFAQAELCRRLGVDFAVYAHSANGIRLDKGRIGLSMDIHEVKSWSQPWDDKARRRIASLVGNGGNVDGHTMEYYRKALDKQDATDKILLYYTDGKMPAANHDEELEVLQREIRTCRQKKYTLLGVGIRTDSPIQHGLDTVQVDTHEDLRKVVEHLGKRLANPGR